MRCQSPVLKALGGAANDPNASDNEVAAVPDWWATAQAARLELVKCAFGLMVRHSSADQRDANRAIRTS